MRYAICVKCMTQRAVRILASEQPVQAFVFVNAGDWIAQRCEIDKATENGWDLQKGGT